MPKLEQRAADGVAVFVEHLPGNVGDNSSGSGKVVVEINEIIVFIERNVVGQGIVRALRHFGGVGQRLGQVARQRETR